MAEQQAPLHVSCQNIARGTKLPVWRRSAVPDNITFTQLALIFGEMLEIPKTDSFAFEPKQKTRHKEVGVKQKHSGALPVGETYRK